MTNISDQEKLNLKNQASLIRRDIIQMLATSGSGHSGGALGMTDIFVTLYFRVLKHNPKDPGWEDRDRLVLSSGHVCPVLYACLARSGYFPLSELATLRQLGSKLQGHPHRGSLLGIETTSGPLGSGLSQACGMALVARMDKKDWRIFCLMSDGEQDEGNTWEAVMLAAKYKLDKITAVIDRNSLQLSGPTEEIMPIDPLKAKYEAFGWNVLEIDGHDFSQIIEAFETAKNLKGKPTVIIAHTVLGKGVSFMEGDYNWHGKVPTKEQAERALRELT